jgi:hypothetical protein
MDLATKVCLHDFQEIVVSPCKNTYHVCDLALRGSDR